MINAGQTYWVDYGELACEENIRIIFKREAITNDPLEVMIDDPFCDDELLTVSADSVFETHEEFLEHIEAKLHYYECIAGIVREQIHQHGLALDVHAREEADDMKMEDSRA